MRPILYMIAIVAMGIATACQPIVPPARQTAECKDRFYRAWPDPSSDSTPSAEITPDDKVFWRITFEVICGELVGNKEIAFWQDIEDDSLTDPAKYLVKREIQPLDCTIKGTDGSTILETEGIILKDRVVLDSDTHIECQEPTPFTDIVRDLSSNTINFCDDPDANQANTDHRCEQFEGENVAIDAEIKIYPNNGASQIVRYPQLDDVQGVSLGVESSKNNLNEIILTLSGGLVKSLWRYRVDDSWHSIKVLQQPSIEDAPANNFNFLVDELGLTQRRTDLPVTHLFSSDEAKTLYIGEGFAGEIRWIIVDPSDTCLSCFPAFFE